MTRSLHIALAWVAASLALQADTGCIELKTTTEEAVKSYLKKRYNLPEQSSLTILESSNRENSCYRKLVIQTSNPARVLTLYLSPDQKYLALILMDLSVDPEIEIHAKRAEVSYLLLADKSPTRGDAKAPVTIVEFSDFQCPFCKRFASFFDTLPDAEKSKVRLIYKQTPLPMHRWAKQAAELAQCAAQRSDDVFWRVHDFFFANQAKLTPDNIREQFSQFAKRITLQ